MHGSTGGGWKRNAPASPRQLPTQPTSRTHTLESAACGSGLLPLPRVLPAGDAPGTTRAEWALPGEESRGKRGFSREPRPHTLEETASQRENRRAMKILIVSPWFRTLAHLYGRVLRDRGGHDVLVLASDRHFEKGYGLCREIPFGDDELNPLAVTRRRRIAGRIREFGPDVMLSEPLQHPAWLTVLPTRTRQVLMLHEPDPTREMHAMDWRRRAVREVQRRQTSAVVCFSQDGALVALGAGVRRVHVVPLMSELPDEWVPRGEGPAGTVSRRGFCGVGRLTHNKGFDIAVDAWLGLPAAVRDREPLTLLVSEGNGYPPATVGSWERAGVVVRRGRFAFRDVLPDLVRSRCVVLPYRNASQSGVQMLALQLGVLPLVSGVGGLPEYQPRGAPVLRSLDPGAWTNRLSALVGAGGTDSGPWLREHYERIAGGPQVLAALEKALSS